MSIYYWIWEDWVSRQTKKSSSILFYFFKIKVLKLLQDWFRPIRHLILWLKSKCCTSCQSVDYPLLKIRNMQWFVVTPNDLPLEPHHLPKAAFKCLKAATAAVHMLAVFMAHQQVLGRGGNVAVSGSCLMKILGLFFRCERVQSTTQCASVWKQSSIGCFCLTL